MSQDVEFLACPTSGCGGLWLAKATIRMYRDRGDRFFCPAGHPMLFVESTQSKLDGALATISTLKKTCPLCSTVLSDDYAVTPHLLRFHRAVRQPRRREEAA